MPRAGEKHPQMVYPRIDGFWVWDVRRDRVYGDANLFRYFGLELTHLADGAPLTLLLDGIDKADRPRAEVAIQEALRSGRAYIQTYSVNSLSGPRKILTAGRCYVDETGAPAMFPGWFMDVSERQTHRRSALMLARTYLQNATDILADDDNEFLVYMIDALIMEVERRVTNDGADQTVF